MKGSRKLLDEELVSAAQKGDEKARATLLDRYKGAAEAKARLYAASWEDSDDLLQEGMIALLNAIKSYNKEKGASFKTFANLCIARRMISFTRASGKEKSNAGEGFFEDFGKDFSGISKGAESPEEAVIYKELSENILGEKSSFLSPFEKQVAAGFLSGKNYREIAKDLSRPPKSVDNARQRIRLKLKGLLKTE